MGLTQSQLDGNAAMEDAAIDQALQLFSTFSIPSTLKAIVELDVIDIIASTGPGAQLSAAQIASKISTSNSEAPVTLDRMMRYLASHSLLTCSEVAIGDGTFERLYGLTPVCLLLIKKQGGSPLPSMFLLSQDKICLDAWQELKYAVLDGVIPFTKVHGMELYEYQGKDPRFGRVFSQSMSSMSGAFMKKMLDTYTGFQDISELVDVGGRHGTALHMIVSKHSHIEGFNFDLPQVVSLAPPLPGVEHVGGDMFANVPNADAIFMKLILHNWKDEDCLKLLKNCFNALPSSGKMIIVEYIIPEAMEPNVLTPHLFRRDLTMLTLFGAKERTRKELEVLAKEAGFSVFDVACCVYTLSVIELLK